MCVIRLAFDRYSYFKQVIHLYMPKSLENYSQEVGRAGRDGMTSTCVMFLSSLDIPTLEGFCRGDTCSKQDLELWLQEVATKVPAPDGTIDFNHYKQGKESVSVSPFIMVLLIFLHLAMIFE